MSKAPVNKIIPFSTVDGPGNRTSVFFQACNIHCLYCHNPETQRMCIDCGDCIKTCPVHALSFSNNKVVWNPSRCVNCDTCIKTCTHYASPKVTEMTPKEVFLEISKNIPFIRGITVSGGECSLYLSFLRELFRLCHENGLTTLMDSNGMIPFPKDDFFSLCDGVMLDIKSWDEEVYHHLTGYSNQVVKENLKYLSAIDRIQELRIVCVPGRVDVKACIDGIKKTIGDKIKTTHLKLITFRNMGVKGELSSLSSPTREEMESYYEYAKQQGFEDLEIR